MKVVVTGGAGYIGSMLVRMLVDKGFDVTVLDRLFFGRESLKEVENKIKIVKEDIRSFDPMLLEGADCVMDLASLSNDPSGDLDPEKTMEINYKGRVRVATLAKKYKVPKYILASSCSVYGFMKDTANEHTQTNPLTTYAKACVNAENDTLNMSDKNFSVTSLRQATVYGYSERMRFDLAVNSMVLSLFKDKKLSIMRDGSQQRPFVHVKDTSNAFITILNSEAETVNGQIFNVGSNDQNFKILELGELVAKSIGLEFKYEWYGSPDFRSYCVNFDKISNVLGYKTKYTPKEGAKEVFDALTDGKLKEDEKTITVKWYKKLIDMQTLLNDVAIDGKIL